MIGIRFLAPREGKKGNGCSLPNLLLLNKFNTKSLIRKRSLGSPDNQPVCRFIRAKEDCKQSNSTKLIFKKLCFQPFITPLNLVLLMNRNN